MVACHKYRFVSKLTVHFNIKIMCVPTCLNPGFTFPILSALVSLPLKT